MPSKNEIKFIRGLSLKKNRNTQGLFVAEGKKLVLHLIKILGLPERCFALEATAEIALEIVSEADMRKLSTLATPPSMIAIFKQPTFTNGLFSGPVTVVLDGIRDPGNLGTILRLCDWFGVTQVVCTPDCVDVYNEKVVQASMGSIATVQVIYAEREAIVATALEMTYPLFGADMNGENMYQFEWPERFGLVIGNEGAGLSIELKQALSDVISIPAAKSARAESLNAAMATGILLSQFAGAK